MFAELLLLSVFQQDTIQTIEQRFRQGHITQAAARALNRQKVRKVAARFKDDQLARAVFDCGGTPLGFVDQVS